MSFTVEPEKLRSSAIIVTGHGEDLATSHTGSGGRIAAAESGWTGRSAVALSRLGAQWATRSRTLVGNIGGHADHLHTGASLYVEQDHHGTRNLEAVAAVAPVDPTAL